MTVTSELCEQPVGIALAALLQDVATELSDLATLAGSVQEALSHCDVSDPPDPETLAKLQGLDRLSQGLDNVGRLMATLPAHLPQDLTVATSALISDRRHSYLRRRAAESGRVESEEAKSRPGDVIWF
ncbi:hypothetical protein R5H32_05175 [Defluviimonas sp. D31]|uniref:hypothetical protein n=1 Tax=Defluviimonas sp. D31 TaxID=3083253 RepID=UPI00296E89FB|nr:hypothetical protein [Defluviimonas sp. D31]MDW4548740.1 hypothetical protein [Defluviimonas sp. D31]